MVECLPLPLLFSFPVLEGGPLPFPPPPVHRPSVRFPPLPSSPSSSLSHAALLIRPLSSKELEEEEEEEEEEAAARLCFFRLLAKSQFPSSPPSYFHWPPAHPSMHEALNCPPSPRFRPPAVHYYTLLSCLPSSGLHSEAAAATAFLPSSVFTGCSGGYRRRRRKWVGQTCRLPILWRRGDERGGEGRALFPPSLHAHPFPTHSFIGPPPLPPSFRPSAKLRDLCGGRGKRKMDFLSSPNYLKAGEQKRERKGEEEVGIFHPTLLKEGLNGRSPLVYRVERTSFFATLRGRTGNGKIAFSLLLPLSFPSSVDQVYRTFPLLLPLPFRSSFLGWMQR